MKDTGNNDRTSTIMSARMGASSWIILIVLLSLLVATGFVIHFGWTTGKRHGRANLWLRRNGVRGDYFAGGRVQSHGAALLQ
jgi:flagellar basal body-associated protein FliL